MDWISMAAEKCCRLLEIVPCQRVIGEDGEELPGLFLAELLFLQKVSFHQGDSLVLRPKAIRYSAIAPVSHTAQSDTSSRSAARNRSRCSSSAARFPVIMANSPAWHCHSRSPRPYVRHDPGTPSQTFALLQRNLGQAAGDGTGQHGHRDHGVSLGLSQFAGIFLMEPDKLPRTPAAPWPDRLQICRHRPGQSGPPAAPRAPPASHRRPQPPGGAFPPAGANGGAFGTAPAIFPASHNPPSSPESLPRSARLRILITHICFLPFHDNLYLL